MMRIKFKTEKNNLQLLFQNNHPEFILNDTSGCTDDKRILYYRISSRVMVVNFLLNCEKYITFKGI